ncbi:zinc finger protein 414 [Sarcophilus harrisii]
MAALAPPAAALGRGLDGGGAPLAIPRKPGQGGTPVPTPRQTPSPPFQAPRGRARSRESRALAQDGGDVSVSPQRGELQREPQNKGSARTRGGMEESSGMGPGVQACPAPLPYSDIYGSPSQSPAAKPEKEQLSPAFSAEDCKHSSRTNTGGGVNSSPSEEPRLPKRRPPSSGRQFPCSSYGCRLAFPNPRELAQHLHSHLQPTQSMEGKRFHCSTPSCSETFPSMQELMTHTKLHYKPNRYFKCENCLLRFRTHRSLFKHLHVCSDQSHSPAPPPAPLPPALEKELPDAQRPAGPGPDKAPLLTPLNLAPDPRPRAPFPLLEASLYSSAALSSYSSQASGPVSAPFLPYLGPSSYGLAPGSSPQRLRPFLPTQAQALPSSGPGSSSTSNAAVWKKIRVLAIVHEGPLGALRDLQVILLPVESCGNTPEAATPVCSVPSPRPPGRP